MIHLVHSPEPKRKLFCAAKCFDSVLAIIEVVSALQVSSHRGCYILTQLTDVIVECVHKAFLHKKLNMEEVLSRVDRLETGIFDALNKLTDEVKEMRKQQTESSYAICHQANMIAASPEGADRIAPAHRIREEYRSFKAVLEHPKANRTSKQTSFCSVGKALHEGIDAYNTAATTNGTSKLPQMTVTPRTFTRDAMRTVGMLLGGSKVFGPHLGLNTYQEIKSIYANTPHTFQMDSSEVSKKLLKQYPILEIAKGGWASHELIKGKLINMKEERKKKDVSCWDTDSQDFHPDFVSEDSESENSSESESEEERRASVGTEINALKEERRNARKKSQH